jgi:hypothetical protein
MTPKDRPEVSNSRHKELFPLQHGVMGPGTPFETIVRRAAEKGLTAEAAGRSDDRVQERIQRRRWKEAVDAFAGIAPRTDDVTALALRWQPAEIAAERPISWAGT